jgi:hypothetical protein
MLDVRCSKKPHDLPKFNRFKSETKKIADGKVEKFLILTNNGVFSQEEKKIIYKTQNSRK